MASSSLIFRADGSPAIGLGHIMRCLAFWQGMEHRPPKALFIIRAYDPRVRILIEACGIEVFEIPTDLPAVDDAEVTRVTAAKENAHILVSDLCTREALSQPDDLYLYHRIVTETLTSVCLSGGHAVDIPSSILVYPYLGQREIMITQTDASIRLFGPAYFIFRQEFTRKASAQRHITHQGTKILVTIGGADELQLSVKVLQALQRILAKRLDVRAVVGPAYPRELRERLRNLTGAPSGRLTLLESPCDLAQAMLWADIAVTGDGLTKYETAVTGTPSLILSRPDSDTEINKEFFEAGTALHAGDGTLVGLETLSGLISSLLNDRGARATMSERGRALFDGRGVQRICQHLPGELLT